MSAEYCVGEGRCACRIYHRDSTGCKAKLEAARKELDGLHDEWDRADDEMDRLLIEDKMATTIATIAAIEAEGQSNG